MRTERDKYQLPTIDTTPEEEAWKQSAACKEADTALFFSEKRPGQKRYGYARQLCESCEVREVCLMYALKHGIDYGMWGGLTYTERKAIKSEMMEAVA